MSDQSKTFPPSRRWQAGDEYMDLKFCRVESISPKATNYRYEIEHKKDRRQSCAPALVGFVKNLYAN